MCTLCETIKNTEIKLKTEASEQQKDRNGGVGGGGME